MTIEIPSPDEFKAMIRECVRDVLLLELKPKETEPNKPISESELCEKVGLSKPTLWKLRKNNKIPFLKVGSRILYNLTDVLAALNKGIN